MIENPRRQAILVLVVTIAAIVAAVLGEPQYGPDLQGGVQLIYEVPEDRLQEVLQQDSSGSLTRDRVMTDTVAIISERADPTGTQEIVVTRRGDAGILVELPHMPPAQAEAVQTRIESLGKLEMRVVAEREYDKPLDPAETGPDAPRVTFDIQAEKQRLESWLGQEGNRELVLRDPGAIERFNNHPDQGPLAAPHLRWYPRKVVPAPKNPEQWGPSLGLPGVVQVQNRAEVPLPEAEDAPEFLLEYVPVNMHERHFEGEDLATGSVHSTMSGNGEPAVTYSMRLDRVTPYGEWTKEYLTKHVAIILNGEVRSAPFFREPILGGQGMISGDFTRKEVRELIKVLQTGSLKVEPQLQSKVVIGATLGEKSVRLGFLSILAGGAIVLAFILAYYRFAGLVAFTAIALNVLFIWGVLMFLQATLTLPGIAGMVLTMGMAVDANILIYERIREEMRKGKDITQAVRTGFERALVTILDSNITTFLAGVVLYNVGVGPVRGFAVTLMVGILTTLFTAYFVTRLIFHVLVESKKLSGFSSAAWLQNARFRFLNLSKPAFALSMVLVVASLGYSLFVVPSHTLLGLDFTGGANMQMSMQAPMAVADVRTQLEQDEEFVGRFGQPQVNYVGEEATPASARRFNVKIKLRDEVREEISQERRETVAESKHYVPPYVTALERVFEEELVPPAFSNATLSPVPRRRPLQNAAIVLHFTSEVRTQDVAAKLNEEITRGVDVAVLGNSEADSGRDLLLQWVASPDTRETELFTIVREALMKRPRLSTGEIDEARDDPLTDVNGETVSLSNPFPEAQEIGGRMVGELRNAAIGALLLAMFLIVMFIRVRFHEYKYGLAAVAALVHDVCIVLGIVALGNATGLVDAELNLPMIAAFLTIIGYSINDTIVIFDRIRENLSERARLGDTKESFRDLVNRSINQTLSRTVLTSGTTMFVVLAQFVVNYGRNSPLEGFSFALILGILSGTYSTIFIASPLVVWMRGDKGFEAAEGGSEKTEPSPAGVV